VSGWRWVAAAYLVVAPWGSIQPAAGARKALVIGNAAYIEAPLPNTINDAHTVAEALHAAGFDVTVATDLPRKELRHTINAFLRDLSPGDVSVLYYAGHGFALRDGNYLLPVDFEAEDPIDAKDDAYRLGALLEHVEQCPPGVVTVLLLDAARDNPYSRRWDPAGTRQGFAPLGEIPPDTYVALSAAPGAIAFNGIDGQNSPFAVALGQYLAVPEVELVDVFRAVRGDVAQKTGGQQVPWAKNALHGRFRLLPNRPAHRGPPAPADFVFEPQEVRRAEIAFEETRGAWASFLAEMQADWALAVTVQANPYRPGSRKTSAWGRFLATFAADDPYTTFDEILRENARGRRDELRANDGSPPTSATAQSPLEGAPSRPRRLTTEQILAPIVSRRAPMIECAARQGGATARVWFEVLGNGRVGRISVLETSLRSTAAVRCVTGQLHRVRFPRFNGQVIRVSMPLDLGSLETPRREEARVLGTRSWQSVARVEAGDRIRARASGRSPGTRGGPDVGPDGAGGWDYLEARIGRGAPLRVGASHEWIADQDGVLLMRMSNQRNLGDNRGEITVELEISPKTSPRQVER